MSILMSGLVEEQVVLCPQDFPLDYVNGQHPEDYLITDAPITPQYIYHHIRGRHNRLWLRVSWQLRSGKFTTMSFLLDTGAPKHLYLCDDALKAVEEDGQVVEDGDMDLQYVKLFGRNCPVESTPKAHTPANIIGLKLLKRLGLELFDDEPHFHFKQNVPYFTAQAL